MNLDITHIAKLANLPMTPDEAKTLDGQLGETLSFIAKLQEIPTKNVEPTAHVTGLENVTRDDSTRPSLTQQQALANSKKTHNGFFEVAAILANE